MGWQLNGEGIRRAIQDEIDKVQLDLDEIDDNIGLEIYEIKVKGIKIGLEKALEIINS